LVGAHAAAKDQGQKPEEDMQNLTAISPKLRKCLSKTVDIVFTGDFN